MVQFKLLEKAPPACNEPSKLPSLDNFFQDTFNPSAIDMINSEVNGTTGRIVAIIGPEYRFMMARRLVTDFLTEYQTLINGYLKKDFGQDYEFKLQMAKVIIEKTSHLFFYKLAPILSAHKLEPIVEKLDHSFSQFF